MMNKKEEIKKLLNSEKRLLISNLNLTVVESALIMKIAQLYFLTNDNNLLKWMGAFLGATICSSLSFDYIKDEYKKDKKELKYYIGDNYE